MNVIRFIHYPSNFKPLTFRMGGTAVGWFNELHNYLQNTSHFWLEDESGRYAFLNDKERQSFKRKQQQLKDREAVIVKTMMDGQIMKQRHFEDRHTVDYVFYVRHLVKQKGQFYVEEGVENRRAHFQNEKLRTDESTLSEGDKHTAPRTEWDPNPSRMTRGGFRYQRLQAVRYADQWWNSYNPDYRTFDVDCTNYVSQCLRAGGAPMTGSPERTKGWWFGWKQWSFSWSVAHALRWYLSGATTGLRAKEMSSANELTPGDVICYDFEGDGHWNHNTIVTAKDANGMPLVNAHTVNRRRHYWSYEDSTAWTPKIQYKFFRIVDDE